MSRRPVTALAAALALAATLAGCGKVGQLERPGPMFGARAAAPADANGTNPTAALETVDSRDRSNDNLPVPGAPTAAPAPNASPAAPPQ